MDIVTFFGAKKVTKETYARELAGPTRRVLLLCRDKEVTKKTLRANDFVPLRRDSGPPHAPTTCRAHPFRCFYKIP